MSQGTGLRRAWRYGREVAGRVLADLAGEVDRVRFELREPAMRGHALARVLPLAADLRGPHCRYMLEATRDEMPITFSLACFLLAYLRAAAPRRIADLGSGFSSFVVRHYAAALPAPERPAIVSVDTSPEWLERTRRFLVAEGAEPLAGAELCTWEAFTTPPRAPFDFVVVDIGSLEFRAQWLPWILRHLLAPGGRAILDDMHWAEARCAARRAVAGAACRALSLRALCPDEYFKVAWVVFREGR